MIELLKSLTTPIVWVLLLMALCLTLTIRSPRKLRFKLGRLALFLGMCILFLFSIDPGANLLCYYLECQFKLPPEEVLSTLDIVVILDGGVRTSGGLREYPEAEGSTYARLFNGVKVFKRCGAATLALCGGGERRSTDNAAEVMKALAIELGVQKSKIMTETKSRNTMQNAAELAGLLPSAKRRRIGLVTSALHMLRSEKVFKKQFPDDTIVPIPVDYISKRAPNVPKLRYLIPSTDALSDSNNAIHEWIGIAWYFIRY
jgi:uncharacterized SAM-binding protein YcdF (DUF218 family)